MRQLSGPGDVWAPMPLSPPTSANPTKSSPTALRSSTRILFPPKSAWVTLSKTSWINQYKNHRFPAEIISHAVWLYFCFCLSYRDVEELLFEHCHLRWWAVKHFPLRGVYPEPSCSGVPLRRIGNSHGLFTPRRRPHPPQSRPRRQAAGRAGGRGCPVWTPRWRWWPFVPPTPHISSISAAPACCLSTRISSASRVRRGAVLTDASATSSCLSARRTVSGLLCN